MCQIVNTIESAGFRTQHWSAQTEIRKKSEGQVHVALTLCLNNFPYNSRALPPESPPVTPFTIPIPLEKACLAPVAKNAYSWNPPPLL